jgi:hypothetical protein
MQDEFKEPPLHGEAAAAGGDSAPDFNYGCAHVNMASTSLLHSHYARDPAHQTFHVPPTDIEQLFHTSLTLDLGPDVTPIQIWANVRRLSQKHRVDSTMLGMIREEFAKYVRCNRCVFSPVPHWLLGSANARLSSFGAVCERNTASAVLAFFFPGEAFTTSWD